MRESEDAQEHGMIPDWPLTAQQRIGLGFGTSSVVQTIAARHQAQLESLTSTVVQMIAARHQAQLESLTSTVVQTIAAQQEKIWTPPLQAFLAQQGKVTTSPFQAFLDQYQANLSSATTSALASMAAQYRFHHEVSRAVSQVPREPDATIREYDSTARELFTDIGIEEPPLLDGPIPFSPSSDSTYYDIFSEQVPEVAEAIDRAVEKATLPFWDPEVVRNTLAWSIAMTVFVLCFASAVLPGGSIVSAVMNAFDVTPKSAYRAIKGTQSKDEPE